MFSEASTIRAVVRAVDGDEAVVQVEESGCGRCHEKGGCGGQHLTQMLCTTPRTYRVDNPGGIATVGDNVTVAIAAGAVRRSANLAYGLPLLGVVAGALVGQQLAGDGGAIAGVAVGLASAWLVARTRVAGGNRDAAIRPYIVGRS